MRPSARTTGRRRLTAVAAVSAVALAAPVAWSSGALAAPATPTCFGLTASPGKLGTPGPDTIEGTDDDDVIIGLNGNDTIHGNGGNDVICGGTGDGQPADQLDDDRITGGSGNDRINGGFGNDRIDGEDGDDTLIGDGEEPTGFISTTDVIDGGNGEDTIRGGGDQDILRGQAGADTIDAVEVGGDPVRSIIDVVIGGTETDTCTADDEDDVSECDDTRSLTSNDDLSPNNSFGSVVSARRRAPSGSGGSSSSDSGGGSESPLFFSSLFRAFDHRCLPGRTHVGSRGIASFRVGERTYRSLFRPIVVLPISARRGRFVYCNAAGGRTFLLSAKGSVRLLASTGEPARTRGVGPGDRIASLTRAYDDAQRVSGALYRASGSSPVFFGVRGGRVRFVAVAAASLKDDPGALARALRRLRPSP